MTGDAPDTLVLGLGNPLRGDDGVGPVVIDWLHRHGLPPGTVVVDGGTGGLELVLTLANCRRAIIVDAVDVGRAPGTWVRFMPDLAISGDMLLLHIAGLSEALALAAALDMLPEEVVIFGVQPAQLSRPLTLSAEVRAAVPEVCRTLLREISKPRGEYLYA